MKENDEVRIGVFVCRCGSNIAGFVDTAEVARYAATLPNVVFVRENLYTCAESGTSEIMRGIREQGLNRVVVASCTPRTHEPTFRATCREAGLNPFLFEFVNIREHCSWVHQTERDAATAKAKDLVRMGVARAALLEPLEEIKVKIEPRALVVGGGITGLTAALAIARQGFHVTLVEKEAELGGLLKRIHKLYPGNIDPEALLKKTIEAVAAQPRIRVLTGSRLVETGGFVGNFEVRIEGRGEVFRETVGAIVVATGGEVLRPDGLYGYDGTNVITHLELEERLKKGLAPSPGNVVMIQCAGARIPERKYCSRVCCMTAVKNALLLKEKNPGANVYILFREMQTYGDVFEADFRRAREAGIVFVRYSLEKPPVVESGRVRVYHAQLGDELEIGADLVVLSTPMVPSGTAQGLAKILRVPLDENGFFLEAHVKLRPLDFSTDGIYLAGCARFPTDVGQCVSQGYGAASRALIPLSAGEVAVEPVVAVVATERCIACGLCEESCGSQAISVQETPGEGRKARVIPASCKGCGTCAAGCPARAISMLHYTDAQIAALILSY
jgi:heterodisulfide reductase subunit A